jgi:PAS domain S-box-containing protein
MVVFMARKLTYKEMEQRIKELKRQFNEHEQAEDALRESEGKIKSILSSMEDVVFMVDKDTRFIFTHPPATGELYRSPEEFMWKKHSEVMPPDIDKLFADAFNKNKKGEVAEYDYCLEIGGKMRWFSVKMSPVLLDGKFNGSVAVARDISTYKQLEKSLRESEEKYKTLFDNTNEAICIADAKTGIVIEANKQAEKLFGLPREEIIGAYHSDVSHYKKVEYYEKRFREFIENGNVFELEAELMKKDGKIVPVIISARVINLGGKEVIQALFKDISNEKMVLELKKEMISKRLVEQAKGILMDRYKISEKEAKRRLQKESRNQRKKMREIAQAVISSELILE